MTHILLIEAMDRLPVVQTSDRWKWKIAKEIDLGSKINICESGFIDKISNFSEHNISF